MVDKRFLIFTLSIFCSQTGTNSIYPLISSLNVNEGIGTTSLAVAYAIALLVTLFTPGLFQLVGVKKLLVTSQVCYIFFLIGNAYTSFFTMIPAGVMLGIAEGTFWSSMSLVVNYFSQVAAKDESNLEKSRSRYTGNVFMALQAGVVTGNSISFIFLFVDRTISNNGNFTQIIDYSYCGANDCQIENITEANIDLYKPGFPATRYTLIAFAALIIGVAITLETIYLPKIVHDRHFIDTISTRIEEASSTNTGDEVACTVVDNKSVDTSQEKNANKKDALETPVISNLTTVNPVDRPKQNSSTKQEKQMSTTLRTIFESLRDLKRLFFIPKQLLVMLMPIYNGMLISFMYGELTRSFGSCVLGVYKVAAASVVLGSADSLFSYISGKICAKFGRNWPFLFAFLLDIASYITCLKWEITQYNTGVVYVLFLSFGSSDGIWQTLINDMYGSYFKGKTAYILWNLLIVTGMTLQYALSKSLCVYIKIYMQITILCLSMMFYGLLQILTSSASTKLAQSHHKPKPEEFEEIAF